MKKLLVILMAVMAVMLFMDRGYVYAVDSYVEIGADITDRGNSDVSVPNTFNVGTGISETYGNCSPYVAVSAGLNESGFAVEKRSAEVGTNYRINDNVTLNVGYNTTKFPTGNRVNQLGVSARYNF